MSEEVAHVPREDTATTDAADKDLSSLHPSPADLPSPPTAGQGNTPRCCTLTCWRTDYEQILLSPPVLRLFPLRRNIYRQGKQLLSYNASKGVR